MPEDRRATSTGVFKKSISHKRKPELVSLISNQVEIRPKNIKEKKERKRQALYNS